MVFICLPFELCEFIYFLSMVVDFPVLSNLVNANTKGDFCLLSLNNAWVQGTVKNVHISERDHK